MQVLKRKNSIKNLKPAKRYAKALMEIAEEHSCAESFDALQIQKDLGGVCVLIRENVELNSFLNNPVVSKRDKKDVLEKLFSKRVCGPLLKFLFVLCDSERLDIIEDVYDALNLDIKAASGVLDALILSAYELDEGQKNSLIAKLQNKTGRKINPLYEIQKELLAGVVIKIKDTVIDLSLKKRLDDLRKDFTEHN